MEIIKYRDLNPIPTSHDPSLLKYVLVSSGKLPSGKMFDFSEICLEENKNEDVETGPKEYYIYIHNIGSSCVSYKGQNTIIDENDMIIVNPLSKVRISSLGSSLYCLKWEMD